MTSVAAAPRPLNSSTVSMTLRLIRFFAPLRQTPSMTRGSGDGHPLLSFSLRGAERVRRLAEGPPPRRRSLAEVTVVVRSSETE